MELCCPRGSHSHMCLLTFEFMNETTLEIQLPCHSPHSRHQRGRQRPLWAAWIQPTSSAGWGHPNPTPTPRWRRGDRPRSQRSPAGLWPRSGAPPARDPWDLSDPAPAGQCWEDGSVGQVEGQGSETGKADSPSRQPEAPRTGQTSKAGPRPRTEQKSQGPEQHVKPGRPDTRVAGVAGGSRSAQAPRGSRRLWAEGRAYLAACGQLAGTEAQQAAHMGSSRLQADRGGWQIC